MTVYDNDREFRLKILALLLDDPWMAQYGDAIINPTYFDMDDETTFAEAIMTYRQKYGRSPKDPYDTIELCKKDISTFVLDMYELAGEEDLLLAADVAIQFAREQAAKIAILESVDDVQAGRIQVAIDRMKDALKVGEGLAVPGIDPVKDIDMWLYDYWAEKTRTGWTHIDKILQGGTLPGEEGIILGPPNRGKSMALINIGYSAASIGSGKNVFHLTHEMSKEQVAKRYAARMIFRFPNPNDNLDDYAEEVITTARRLLTGKIRIIGGKKSTVQIEAHLEQLEADDFHPDLIIDDYLDHIIPPKHYSERRFELSAIYDWFRDLCAAWKVPGWSASQAGRDSLSKEIVTIQSIAEDIGKANIADVIIALCQTRDEEDVDQCRLFMAKVRDGESKGMIKAKYYKKSQAIITTGYVVHKKEELDV